MKFKKLFSGLLFATFMLTGCSENQLDEPNSSEKGEDSYAAFSIKFGNPSLTRSEDENAANEEMTINDVKIFIFSNGILEVAASPALEENVTVPVAISTGEKVVYAVTNNDNIPLTVVAEQTKLSDFEKTLFASLNSDIAKENEFVMIGRSRATIVKCTKEEAKADPVALYIDRASAKLQVKFDPENVKIYPTMNADFSDCGFAPAQCARQMHLTALEGLFTPLGEKIAGSGTYTGLTEIPATFEEGFFTPAVINYSPSFSTNRYLAENISEQPTTGKASLALMRLKVTPHSVYGNKTLEDNTFFTVARNAPESATWIYASDKEYNILYFASEEDAAAYIEENNLPSEYAPYKFDKGLCYYRVYLKSNQDPAASLSEKYRVVRNGYYRVNITDIKNLGSPTGPGVIPEDPDTPIDQDSYISCEITIVPWVMHEQNGVLQ